jgi:hypothetical protein
MMEPAPVISYRIRYLHGFLFHSRLNLGDSPGVDGPFFTQHGLRICLKAETSFADTAAHGSGDPKAAAHRGYEGEAGRRL